MILSYVSSRPPLPPEAGPVYSDEPFPPEWLKKYWEAEEAFIAKVESEDPNIKIIRAPYMPLIVHGKRPV